MGHEATVSIKKLAASLAIRRNENYFHVISWMCCFLSFSLARSAIRCVRGSRSIHRKIYDGQGLAPVDLVHAEALRPSLDYFVFPCFILFLSLSCSVHISPIVIPFIHLIYYVERKYEQ